MFFIYDCNCHVWRPFFICGELIKPYIYKYEYNGTNTIEFIHVSEKALVAINVNADETGKKTQQVLLFDEGENVFAVTHASRNILVAHNINVDEHGKKTVLTGLFVKVNIEEEGLQKFKELTQEKGIKEKNVVNFIETGDFLLSTSTCNPKSFHKYWEGHGYISFLFFHLKGFERFSMAIRAPQKLWHENLRQTIDVTSSAHIECRYPNPYSKHVLTEDIVHREVTSDQKLLSRRLLTKTNRMPRWAERLFPANVAHSVYILEDSIVDPQNQTMTTFTWNINHARLMVVEERCVYRVNSDNSGWTEIRREAWVSSSLFGISRAVQEFGLAQFKSNVTKTMKGFEYILAKLQGEAPPKTLVETAKEAKEKAKETALAATEKAKDLASKAATKKQQQQQ
ncbi:hypothetical protein R6Z07F_019652 [Ovis aries]